MPSWCYRADGKQRCEEGLDAGEDFKTDVALGHALLGVAGASGFVASTSAASAQKLSPQGSVTPAVQSVVHKYALRHTLAHLCLAETKPHQQVGGNIIESTEALRQVLLSLPFWQVKDLACALRKTAHLNLSRI